MLSRSPAIWTLCKGISVAGDAKAIARFEPLCKVISVIHDGKSVARSGVLCKGISVTCNGKTQRLFWAFRNSCVTDFHFRSDKKIRVWRWVAPAGSGESTPPYIPAYAYLPAFLFAYQKRALGGYFSPWRDGGYGGTGGGLPHPCNQSIESATYGYR